MKVTDNSRGDEWGTPAYILDAARGALGGDFDTDPASNEKAQEFVRAGRFYTKEEDGLTKVWAGRVWLNPPYSRGACEQFIEQAINRWRSGYIVSACILVNNFTDTETGQMLLNKASAVCFLRGRVHFLDGEGERSKAPRQGQMVVLLGNERIAAFREAFNLLGVVYCCPKAQPPTKATDTNPTQNQGDS